MAVTATDSCRGKWVDTMGAAQQARGSFQTSLGSREELDALAQRLSVRDRLFVRGILEGKSASQAYREAGYNSKHPDVMGSRKLHQGCVSRYLLACARAGGYGTEELIELAATTIAGAMRARRVAEFKGQPVDLGPDYMAQLKAIDFWMRLVNTLQLAP